MPPGRSRARQQVLQIPTDSLVLNRRNRRGKKKLTPVKKFIRNIRVRKRGKLTKSL